MPGKNLARVFVEGGYYHVYNRGVAGEKVFRDEDDYAYLSHLFARHLSSKPQKDKKGRPYTWLRPEVSVLAYCWMPTHYHLLLHQDTEQGIVQLMLSVCTAYTMYFNKKYQRRGPLFENNYRASLILNDSYLLHISRYIHLNPHARGYSRWPHSSYQDYVGHRSTDWLTVEPVLDLFESVRQYKEFTADYESAQKELDNIKHQLADR